jgi:hypothetical protein
MPAAKTPAELAVIVEKKEELPNSLVHTPVPSASYFANDLNLSAGFDTSAM